MDLGHLKRLNKDKRSEINYLSEVQSGMMNSTLNVAVNVGNIEEVIKNSFKIFKGSYLPLIAYEASRLLVKYKKLNAYFTDANIAYYKEINIG